MTGPGVRIENIFHLLAYARNRLEIRELLPVGRFEGLAPWDFYAELFANCVHALRRRGFPREYRLHVEETSAPRGRILLAPSLSRAVPSRLTCAIDELTPDIPYNQLLKATARGLAGRREVDPGRRATLRDHARFLGSVSDVAVMRALLREARHQRLDALQAFTLDLCELFYATGLPDASGGPLNLRRLDENPQIMGWLFEEFVRCFLKRNQRRWSVRKPQIQWDLDESARTFLPSMFGDILLERHDRSLLIEVKYARRTLVEHRGRTTLRSGHIYQVLTYLEHLARARGSRPEPEGLLLYAKAERALDLKYRLGGKTLRVRTLNLDQPWWGVEGDLLAMVGVGEPSSGRAPTICSVSSGAGPVPLGDE